MHTVQNSMKDTGQFKICNGLLLRSKTAAFSSNLQRHISSLVRKLHYVYLTSANTVSEDSDGDGAITISGSPSSTSSQSIWMWKNTGQKHLKPDWGILIHLTRRNMYLTKNWIKRKLAAVFNSNLKNIKYSCKMEHLVNFPIYYSFSLHVVWIVF